MPLIESSGGAAHQFYASTTTQVTKYITYSVFAKPNGRNHIQHQDGPFVHDLVNGTTSGSATGEYVSATTTKLANGWCRCTMTRNHNNSYDQFNLKLHNGSAPSYSGDGSSGVYIWGVQQEDGQFATSYIPTNGATVTRGADSVKVEGEEFSEFYNDTENTTIMVGKRLGNQGGADGRLYSISDGTNNNRIDWDLNDGTNIRLATNKSSTAQMLQEISSWSDIDKEFKIAAGMAVNNQIGVVNGTAIAAADTSCAMPEGVDRLYFGLRGNEGNQGSLTIKRFMFYPKRLPDSQLVTLTS